MNEKVENKEENKEEKAISCGSCETGTTSLVVGSFAAVYGLYHVYATGGVCMSCVIVAPLMLGFGTYLKLRYLKQKKTQICPMDCT